MESPPMWEEAAYSNLPTLENFFFLNGTLEEEKNFKKSNFT